MSQGDKMAIFLNLSMTTRMVIHSWLRQSLHRLNTENIPNFLWNGKGLKQSGCTNQFRFCLIAMGSIIFHILFRVCPREQTFDSVICCVEPTVSLYSIGVQCEYNSLFCFTMIAMGCTRCLPINPRFLLNVLCYRTLPMLIGLRFKTVGYRTILNISLKFTWQQPKSLLLPCSIGTSMLKLSVFPKCASKSITK
jgi:hypothetical protein